MPVRLDAYLTSCRCVTVFGTFTRISNNVIQTWMANNGGTNRCATDIAIQNLMANNAGTIRYASDISIHKSMVNNVGTFKSCSDKLSNSINGTFRRVSNIAI